MNKRIVQTRIKMRREQLCAKCVFFNTVFVKEAVCYASEDTALEPRVQCRYVCAVAATEFKVRML
jgi:hypothetical protein